MPDSFALSQETYDRFNRAASVVNAQRAGGGGPQTNTRNAPTFFLRVSSSTIGTYGYPAKYQVFDTSAGTWGDDADRPETVYLNDITGFALTSGEKHWAAFSGFRGSASEAVYTTTDPMPLIPDTAHDVKGKINLVAQHLGNGQKGVDSLWIGDYTTTAGTGCSLQASAGGKLAVGGWNSGTATQGEIQTAAFTVFDAGAGGPATAARIRSYSPSGSLYGMQFTVDYTGTNKRLFEVVYSGSAATIGTDSIYLDSNCHAFTYSVRYGSSTIYTGKSSNEYDPGADDNNMRGAQFVHGIYIGGKITMAFSDITGTLDGGTW